MKTYHNSGNSNLKYLLLGLISVIIYSCGSFQNSSYYDSDGIYGDPKTQTTNYQNNQYQEYFGSRLNNSDSTQYSNNNLADNNQQQDNYNSGYANWGGNSGNTTVNVYSDWGWNTGWGYSPYY